MIRAPVVHLARSLRLGPGEYVTDSSIGLCGALIVHKPCTVLPEHATCANCLRVFRAQLSDRQQYERRRIESRDHAVRLQSLCTIEEIADA